VRRSLAHPIALEDLGCEKLDEVPHVADAGGVAPTPNAMCLAANRQLSAVQLRGKASVRMSGDDGTSSSQPFLADSAPRRTAVAVLVWSLDGGLQLVSRIGRAHAGKVIRQPHVHDLHRALLAERGFSDLASFTLGSNAIHPSSHIVDLFRIAKPFNSPARDHGLAWDCGLAALIRGVSWMRRVDWGRCLTAAIRIKLTGLPRPAGYGAQPWGTAASEPAMRGSQHPKVNLRTRSIVWSAPLANSGHRPTNCPAFLPPACTLG
jgi:hypothetical protein